MNQLGLLPDLKQLQDVVGLLESVATLLALVLGGVWAYWLFCIRRQRHPRADVTQWVVHHPLTDKKVLVSVETIVLNSGEVLLPLCDGEVWVQQILPLVNPRLVRTIEHNGEGAQVRPSASSAEAHECGQQEIAWPLCDMKQIGWQEKHMEIEPGEKVRIRCDFILEHTIELIRVYSLVANAAYEAIDLSKPEIRQRWKFWRKQRLIPFWDAATIYSLRPPVDVPTLFGWQRFWQKVNQQFVNN
jgi:hypothetical protein